jgi:hypothetical protein
MAELDTIWREDRALAQRMLDAYVARGANHIVVNTAVAGGYHNQYPAHDWRGQADAFADYLEWLTAHGLAISLWVLPDVEPYYYNREHPTRPRTFDWDVIERDLTPIYTHPRVQAVAKRVVYMWEDYQHSSEMVRGYDYLARVFPDALRYWHNEPGHGSPGLSDENEEMLWRLAAAHGIDGMYLQAWPPSKNPIPGTPVGPPIVQLRYDLWDMHRRFHGIDDSPWGVTPILKRRDGTPLDVVWCEGTAFAIYNADYPDTIGDEWARAALGVDGVTDALDGLLIGD